MRGAEMKIRAFVMSQRALPPPLHADAARMQINENALLLKICFTFNVVFVGSCHTG